MIVIIVSVLTGIYINMNIGKKYGHGGNIDPEDHDEIDKHQKRMETLNTIVILSYISLVVYYIIVCDNCTPFMSLGWPILRTTMYIFMIWVVLFTIQTYTVGVKLEGPALVIWLILLSPAWLPVVIGTLGIPVTLILRGNKIV